MQQCCAQACALVRFSTRKTRHVAPNNVAIKSCDRLAGSCKCWFNNVRTCCVEMLLLFDQGFNLPGGALHGKPRGVSYSIQYSCLKVWKLLLIDGAEFLHFLNLLRLGISVSSFVFFPECRMQEFFIITHDCDYQKKHAQSVQIHTSGKGISRGGSWGAREPPFVSLFVSKQPTIFR